MNQLFQGRQQPTQQMPNNMIDAFRQFRQSFTGDGNAAKVQIQQMIDSGQVTQAQYNQAVQMANQYAGILRGLI